MFLLVFFFFKQKTAYEMRISDWSSDVCSSDLASSVRCFSARLRRLLSIAHASTAASRIGPRIVMKPHSMMCLLYPLDTGTTGGGGEGCMGTWATIVRAGDADGRYQSFDPPCCRSEEHTSEIQSLMRISYAVLCL